MADESVRISNLPLYSGASNPAGLIPITIMGVTYGITPQKLFSLSEDVLLAIQNANTPNSGNPFATINDLTSTDSVARNGELKLKTKGIVGGVVNPETDMLIYYGDWAFGIGMDATEFWDNAQYLNLTSDNNTQNRLNYGNISYVDEIPLLT